MLLLASRGSLLPHDRIVQNSITCHDILCRLGTPVTMDCTTGSCRAGPHCHRSPCSVMPLLKPYCAASQNCCDALLDRPAAARMSPVLSWHACLPAAQKKYPSGTLAEQFVTPAECLTRIDQPGKQPMARWSTLLWFSIAQGALTRGGIQAGQVTLLSLDWSSKALTHQWVGEHEGQ